jgi:hypothetical protein
MRTRIILAPAITIVGIAIAVAVNAEGASVQDSPQGPPTCEQIEAVADAKAQAANLPAEKFQALRDEMVTDFDNWNKIGRRAGCATRTGRALMGLPGHFDRRPLRSRDAGIRV